MYDCISWINRNYKKSRCVHSKKYLDFGRGFYITTFENQAKKWAARKGMRQEKAAIVNVYELSEEWDDFEYYLLKKKMRNGLILLWHVEKDSH